MKLLPKWREAEFIELLKHKPEYGANAPSVPFIPGMTPRLVRITDIDASGRLLEEPKVGILPDAARGCELSEGDILIARTGATVGKSVRIGLLPYPASFAGYLIRFVVDEFKVDAGFVFQYLNSPQYWQWIATMQRAGAQPNINCQEYCGLVLRLPPIPEQRKIANILATWDEASGRIDSLIAAKERRKTALMRRLLTGAERLVPFRKVEWTRVRMSDLLNRVFRPIAWSPEEQLSLVSIRRRCGGLFRRPDIQASDYKTQDLHVVKSGDFLISKRQVVHGAWSLVKAEFSGCQVSKEYAIMVNTAPGTLHMPFFGWLAQLPRMIRLARVASTGVHIEKLIFDPDVFLREHIRIPSSLAEQQAIATILDSCDDELRLLRAQCAALDLQKRGLMQLLLTGKVRIRHL